MVNSNPGAIGIVDVYSINSHAKVVKVDGKLSISRVICYMAVDRER
jgi:hypothetical protein